MSENFESSVMETDAPEREAMPALMSIGSLPPAGCDLHALAAQIRYWHRQRQFAMQQRKGADNALGAFLRVQLGWSKALPADERKAIAARAQDLIGVGEKAVKEMAKLAEKRKPVSGINDPVYREWAGVIEAAVLSRGPFDKIEAEATKRMAALAEELPVWSWAEPIRGFGAVSLAQIVAEAGLVSCDKQGPAENGNYPNPGKLWKRMGVAVMDGKRQGGLSKNAPKDDWIAHGYSRPRRSILWNIGEALIKLNQDGEYRQLYLARKQYERDKAEAEGLKVVPAAKIPKGQFDKYRSDGHVADRARRYMEKRLLRNLWRAWREAIHAV